ncbi:hypothetical protein UYSO10_3013 [Kosakonia radicincitans]|nr:hypothetical protein UYSO10_3013 [Kosakonia radicincitans]
MRGLPQRGKPEKQQYQPDAARQHRQEETIAPSASIVHPQAGSRRSGDGKKQN